MQHNQIPIEEPLNESSPSIRFMKFLGYKSNSGGICFGIANMAMQAILVDEFSIFNKRLQKIERAGTLIE
ncbi:MAG: hypothetical protein P4M14_07010 [Gammaproteobacteria bacterium]|nr:hypothetical protein [Gammaproteobacteria bacterium]